VSRAARASVLECATWMHCSSRKYDPDRCSCRAAWTGHISPRNL
jgi:hypothetical protein